MFKPVALLATCALIVAYAEAPPPPIAAAPTISLMSDVQYGTGATASGDMPLYLDIYSSGAACDAPRPTVMFVHGGGFQNGNKTGSNAPALAEAIVARGMNFVSIQYRLAGDLPLVSAEFKPLEASQREAAHWFPAPRYVGFVAAVEDTVRAMRWLEAKGAGHCVDVNKLALAGSSAGAMTVMNVAYRLDEFAIERPEPLAVVDFWGEMWNYEHIDGDEAPLLILHGSDDEIVGIHNAEKIHALANAAGLPHSYYKIEGGRHSFSGIGYNELMVDDTPLPDVVADFVAAHVLGDEPAYETRVIARAP